MMRAVDLHEGIGRNVGQSADGFRAVINGQHEPTAMHDTGLAQDHKLFGSEIRVFDLELARIPAATQPVGEVVQGAPKTVAPEGVSKVWEFSRFANDDAIQVHGRRVEHHFDGSFRQAAQTRMNVRPILSGNGLNSRQFGFAAFFEERGEERRLTIEMIVKRALRNTGFPRNLRHGRAFITACEKDLFRSLQNLLALGAHLAQRCAGLVRHTLGAVSRRAGHEWARSFSGKNTISNMLTELVGHRKIISVSGVSL